MIATRNARARRPSPGHRQRVGSTVVLERAACGAARVQRTVLPGGLRVITESVDSVRSASVGIWIGVGSRDEGPTVAGAAHFLEHLLFKGTANRSAAAIAEQVDAVGGELNAFTAKEHTCYYAHVLDEDLPLAVDLLCDVVFDATCAKHDVDLERGVVLEEIAMRDDDPEDLLHEDYHRAWLGEHPLARPVLGTEDSVNGMTRTRLNGFWRRRYAPDRMVIAAAGNITHREVLRLVRKTLGDRIGGQRPPRPPRGGTARPPARERMILRSDDTEQAHLMLGVRGLGRHDQRRDALAVLNVALGGGMSSRLFQEVREQRGLAYQVYSSTACYADTGNLTVYAGCQPQRLGEVAGVVRAVLDRVAAEGLSPAELARGKGQLRGELVLGLEDTSSRMARIGAAELNHAEHRSVEERLERIDAVTERDVAALAATLLTGRVAASVVGPYAHADELPEQLHEVMA